MSTVDERPPTGSDEPEEPTNRPMPADRLREWLSRRYARRIVLLTILLTLAVFPVAWLTLYFTNLSGAPASPIMEEIEQTMFVFMIVCAPLMAVTLAVLIYSLFGWGRTSGENPPDKDGPAIRTNATAIGLWVSVTSVLAFFLVVWGMMELATISAYSYGATDPNDQPNSQKPLIVNVTGQQWVWTFEYPDDQKVSTAELVVPQGRPIYFNVTSEDVVHNFWVVELGVKIDANPGAVTNTGVTPTKLGTFNIRCAELCGLHHAYMETTIKVVTPDEFESWIRERGGRRTA